MSDPDGKAPLAAIFGCAGPVLAEAEAEFFAETQPFGFILFARNCESPEQIRRLTADLRRTVGRADAPVLIDQEGGRVQRLKPPQWRAAPPAARFGALAAKDPAAAQDACRLNARLIAAELAGLGIDIDCLPCLDIQFAETHAVIGDRAFSADPGIVAALGRAQADGLAEAGVLPVMKHLPGHGRAKADSHHELPVVSTGLEELKRSDFAPFRDLRDLPMAMTAHIVYAALDADRPATQSATVISQVIRGEIGFQGLLMSDDIGMSALHGGFAHRAEASLAAGCDLVLHCSGRMVEMLDTAAACRPMSATAWAFWQKARADFAARPAAPGGFEVAAAAARVDELLALA